MRRYAEFCYNIRYFELNGRGRGDPWSLRQTGVYQQYRSDGRSRWVLLNYSQYMEDRVEAALQESCHSKCHEIPLQLHLFIILAATRNWEGYIGDLQQRVTALVSITLTLNALNLTCETGGQSKSIASP